MSNFVFCTDSPYAVDVKARKIVPLTIPRMRTLAYGHIATIYNSVVVDMDGNFHKMVVKQCGSDTKWIREIEVLKRLEYPGHKNVIYPYYIFYTYSENSFWGFYTMDYMSMDLHTYIFRTYRKPLDLLETKTFTWQLFYGLQYIHSRKIIHRDIRPKNILINSYYYTLKISDFSCSILEGEPESDIKYVVTRECRAPELFLDAPYSSTHADIWSAGVVVGTMLRGDYIFTRVRPNRVFGQIVRLLGMPTEEEYVAMGGTKKALLSKFHILDSAKTHEEYLDEVIQNIFPKASQESLDFLFKILVFNPKKRYQGPDLLADPFFDEIFDRSNPSNHKKFQCIPLPASQEDRQNALSDDYNEIFAHKVYKNHKLPEPEFTEFKVTLISDN